MAVDEVGRLEAEDVRMIELRGQPHFARKVVERFLGHQTLVRNLQRNVHAFERIEARNTVAYGPFASRALSLYLPIFCPGRSTVNVQLDCRGDAAVMRKDAGCGMQGQGIRRLPCIPHPHPASSQRRHIDVVEIPLVVAHVLYFTL